MRVLHVSAGNLYGGVETLLVTLARLRDLSPAMEPEFAFCFEGRLSRELKATGVPVHCLGAVRLRYPISVWRARRKLAELLQRWSFDVVVCHMAWAQAMFGPVVRSAALPLVFWLHLATVGRHWLERLAALTRPDFAICPSRFVADTLRYIYPQVAAEVLYYPIAPSTNGSHPSPRHTIRSELGVPADAVVVIQASRMEQWKGQSVCLEAFGKLSELPGWECWQIGGPQRPAEQAYFDGLKAQAERLAVAPRVRFFGQRSDVSRLLCASDLYCQPNTGPEGLPIVFGEALYAGLPIVSSALGGFWELVDESCGALVPPGDVPALAATLRRLIEDRDLLKRLSSCAPERARRFFDPGSQVPRLENILAEVREHKMLSGPSLWKG